MSDAIETAADRIKRARSVTVVTGAGVSLASGVPAFRGSGGLWRSHQPERLATRAALAEDPALVWEWYQWRRQTIARCNPNRGHEVLAQWSRRFPKFNLITQNVDGLHERAGTANITRFHGSIWEVCCFYRCAGSPTQWSDDNLQFPSLPPPCSFCTGFIRPNVVLFGEPIPAEALARADRATRCELFLTVGTSSVVYPAAALSEYAVRNGAFTIEINPEPTPVSSRLDLAIAGTADQVLDALATRIGN